MRRAISLLAFGVLVGCTDDAPVTPPVVVEPVAGDECLAVAGSDDADGDGVIDSCDRCEGEDYSGDTDGDGVCDDLDPCPQDAVDDTDGDGVCDSVDVCPGVDDGVDADGDGFVCSLDCNDADAQQYPGAEWYLDADGDGFGDETVVPVVRCETVPDRILVGGDCDDSDPRIHPDATEWCDGVDTDCNPATPEPKGVVHEFKNGTWADVTGDWTVATDAAAPKTYTTDADTVMGFCGVSGHFRFDVRHHLTVVGVDRPTFFGSDGATFNVGDVDATELQSDVSLNASGFLAQGHTSAFLDITWAAATLTDIVQVDAATDGATGALVRSDGGTVVVTGFRGEALGGRAIHAANGSVVVDDSTFAGYSAAGTGGTVYAYLTTLSITDSTFEASSAGQFGGAVHHQDGDATIASVRFSGNSVTTHPVDGDGDGGALSLINSVATLKAVEFHDNNAEWAGGGVYVRRGSLAMDGVEFTQNTAGAGAALTVDDNATVTLAYGTFLGNHATGPAGMLWIGTNSQLQAVGVTAIGNTSGEGGGIWAYGSFLHLRDSTFKGNVAESHGGTAALHSGSRLLLDGSCVMHGNRAKAWGNVSGALHVFTGAGFTTTGCDFGADDSQYNSPRVAASDNVPFAGPDPTSSFRCISNVIACTEVDASQTANDADEDGIPDDWDACVGDDTEDQDGDGLPCLYDEDEM